MTAELIPYEKRIVYVRFEGRSQDIAFATLDVGDLSSDQDVRNAIKRLISLLEPCLILFMAFVVGSIVITMLLAIISVNDISF